MTSQKYKLLHLNKSNNHQYQHPDSKILEKVLNPHPDADYVVTLNCPEFTSICPVTGQPDFAHIIIDYLPKNYLVESKSLKLYLTAFRNHGAFHEDCTMKIAKDLQKLLDPKWFRIGAIGILEAEFQLTYSTKAKILPKDSLLKNMIFQIIKVGDNRPWN